MGPARRTPRRAAPGDDVAADGETTFQIFASTWLARRQRKVVDATYQDYRWRLARAWTTSGRSRWRRSRPR